MMSSMDRMFDDMTRASGHQSSSSSSYFYESRTRTVGPDGVVREEVVREQPGQDGRPHTTRQVRQTDQYGRVTEGQGQSQGQSNRSGRIEGDEVNNNDVVIEELDEYGNVINNCIDQQQQIQQQEEEEEEHRRNRDRDGRNAREGWWQSRMRNVRGNRA